MSNTVSDRSIPLTSRVDPDLEAKSRRSTERICENLHIIANEPSLALYRISEHVRKALPPTVESRCEVKRLHSVLTGALYDAEYGLSNVQTMESVLPVFANIEKLLRKSILLQQSSKHEPVRRVKKEPSSLYQRFSVHLPSVDIPDLAEFKETARGTATRVENAINKDKPSQKTCTRSKSELGPSGGVTRPSGPSGGGTQPSDAPSSGPSPPHQSRETQADPSSRKQHHVVSAPIDVQNTKTS